MYIQVYTERMIKEKLIVIRLSITEKETLDKCVESLGCKKSEFIRSLIRQKGEKMFPYYKVKGRPIMGQSEETPLTVEQMCEAIGGRLIKEKGVMVCRTQEYKNALSEGHVDLDLTKEVLKPYLKK